MSLDPIEQHLFAYFIAGPANDFNVAGRFYPYGELVLVLEDKFKIAARKFGFKVTSRAKTAATDFLDQLIAGGAYSTKQNDFGGTMHQFQPDVYREMLKSLQDGNAIVQQAQASGADFWAEAFTGLTQ